MQVDVFNTDMIKVDTLDLPDDVFGAEVKEALLWEQVKAQRASHRRGTHQTKDRAAVAGGGAKPYRQKGTGRARQGSSRAPHFVGGGVVFGPRPRDYSYRLPRSARRAALRSALSLRVQGEGLVVLAGFSLEAPRTKAVVSFLEKLGNPSALLVDVENGALERSTRNLQKAKFISAQGINVYDILDYDKLVVTKAALETIVGRAQSTGKKAQAA